MDFILPRFPNKHWEIIKFHDFPLIFDENPSIFIENQWKIMEFKDFPRFVGKSGKYEIHPQSSLRAELRGRALTLREAALEHVEQVPADRAANAAVHHLQTQR